MIQTIPGMHLLVIILGILIASLIVHIHYFFRIEHQVKKTSDRAFKRDDLMTALRINQGSNFNTVMLFSWSIFLVAFAFLYFMTPNILGTWNYFEVPMVASDSFGLAYFGVAVILVPGILVALFVPQTYGYYLISKNMKQLTLLAPAFLLVSISCTVYLGTIYPEINPTYWYMGYGALLISLGLMLAPIAKGYIEEMRI
jgi:hypothetical protein